MAAVGVLIVTLYLLLYAQPFSLSNIGIGKTAWSSSRLMAGCWATHARALLRNGERAVIRPTGNSMTPLVESGSKVTLEPIESVDQLAVGDIVLCRVEGQTYLHLVKTKSEDGRVLIGNNKGWNNGWTSSVYGRAIRVEN